MKAIRTGCNHRTPPPGLRRTRRARADPETRQARPADSVATAGRHGARPAEDDRDLTGLLEARLREIGVTSPRFLRRASALDRNGRNIITEAAAERLTRHAPRAGLVAVPDAGRPPSYRVSHLPTASRSPEEDLEAEP